MAQPSGGVKKVISRLTNSPGIRVWVFQTGGEDCAGSEPLVKMIQAKGMNVEGKSGILNTPGEASKIEEKIEKLLENF